MSALPCLCRDDGQTRFEHPECPRHVLDVARRLREARSAPVDVDAFRRQMETFDRMRKVIRR